MFRKWFGSRQGGTQAPAEPARAAPASQQPQQAQAAGPEARASAQVLIAAGNAAEDAGRLQEARDLYARAVASAPDLPAAHLNLGIAQEALGDTAAARACFERVLALQSDHPFGAYNLAKLHFVEGRPALAEPLLRRAVAAKADFFEAWVLLSNALDAAGNLQGAADANARALALQPAHAGALFNQAGILRRLGQLDAAAEAAVRAADLDPQPDYLALANLLLFTQGFAAEALVPVRRAIAAAPHLLPLRSRELFLLNLVEGETAERLFERHAALGREIEAAVAPRSHPARPAPRARLRVGFVSEDLHAHPVAMFLLPLLQGRTRERFEVFCYSSGGQADHVTRQLREAADHWRDASAWHDLKLAEAIAGDAIDILIDLQGHTGSVRLGVFAAKPAPVQVSWVGYLNTTGLTRMDYRLTDARCDPPSIAQPLHTERLLLLPHSQWCYRPFLDVPPAEAAPCERNGFVTFGSFNNVTKLTETMAHRWGRILRRLPDARLLVAGVGSERKRTALLEAIAQAGADRERVEFAPRLDLAGYYRLMHRVDIALDSYPYGGGTTTFDALWMGVPVLTAPGDLPASRSAASVLSALDLPDWIAPGIDQYEELAVQRAADTARIAALRRSLRERLRGSPLMDEAGFVAAFEAALEQAWRERAGD
jgi:predicted O-linked N-acetylglucosamine transferase (SPINDLY family)